MLTHKKKIIVFLAAVLLGSVLLVLLSPSSADQSTKPVLHKSYFLSGSDPNFSNVSGGGVNSQELFYKMMFSVVLVIALGAGAIYISKKFMPKITKLSGKKIRIIETVHLGPRRAVHLMKVGGQMILIGSTNQSITKLADVTVPFADVLSQKLEND